MTSDPPSTDFEDVQIGNWQSCLPSAICTDKEIFDEIFSLQTWKTVLKPDQRDRILKTLPPELLKIPGAAEKTIEDLFTKSLTNFGSNPVDTFFDKLVNGHLDPEVVETKKNIVREWRRESLRLRKQYHTKLLENIVISRDKHLNKYIPLTKKNGKKALSSSNTNPSKSKNGKPATLTNNNGTNGVGGKGKQQKNEISAATGAQTPNNRSKSGEQNKNKRSREATLQPTSSGTDILSEGPTKKKARQQSSSSSKSKTSTKKSKDIVIVTSQQPPKPIVNAQMITGNGTGVPSVAQHKSVLLGTISAVTPLTSVSDPPTLSLRSPSAAAPPPPTSLLESLTAPINPPLSVISNDSSTSLKQYQKIFPSPSPTLLSNASPAPSPSFLPSPVQSSPILASQLQAPSPISVNLNTITSLRSSGSSTSPQSASQSSITLNYTQAPPGLSPSQQHNKILVDDESSDEFEFETIEPTIGFNGSTIPSSKSISTVSTSSFKSTTSGAFNNTKVSPPHQSATISSQQLANIQKCSLLTNCLTQPLSTSASVAALANTILTACSPTMTQQMLPQQKLIVTSGIGSGVGTQLHKFISTTTASSLSSNSQKLIAHHESIAVGGGTASGVFQQKNVISAITSPNTIATHADAQSLVNSIMASSKDLLATFGASITNPQIHPTISHSGPSVLPISVSLQGVTNQQQTQMKPTFIRAPSVATGLLPPSSVGSSQQQQLLSLPLQAVQGTPLSTQSLQSPTGLLSNKGVSTSIPNLLDADDLSLNLGSFSMSLGMNLDMGVGLPDIDGGVGGTVDGIKLEMDCGMDKMDDLSVLDGNPFDSIPNLSDELDGLDLDMVDGLCDFEGLLSEEKQYSSFFALIREVLCSTRDHRMTLVCMEKTIRKWATSPGAGLNPWYMRVNDWNGALIVGLNFLAGNYQDVHPEDFVPYIEYKYKTKYYQWIGAGRDGDNNLSPLCNLWVDNLDRLPPLKKAEGDGEEAEEEEDENEDSDTAVGGEDVKKKNKRPQTPPPPRCTTDWTVRPSTLEEKKEFRAQEKSRFDNPHKAFTYRMHGYESVVGPVKGVYSSQTGITNKARGHSLLVDDRPPYVTILALVRDAVARLPNGEGTRSEICEMLRDSAFLAPEASNVTLNSVVSGALDRLHYERDPCVRYDSHKKSWIYLHRDRTQEQFERLHHNRSYTKSTKSRNSSNRKSRKGSSKNSQTSTATTSTTTTSSSSSSSQSSLPAASVAETPQTTGVNIISTNTKPSVSTVTGGIVSSSSGGSLVTLPPLASLTQKGHNINALAPKQTIGVVSVTTQQQVTGVQVQSAMTTSYVAPQPAVSAQLSSSLATIAGNRGIVNAVASLPGDVAKSVVAGLQSAVGDSGQQSLNEVLAAAAGLRFQTVQTTPPSINATMSSGSSMIFGQQGKPQQGTVVQDQVSVSSQQPSAPTARLLIQPSAQPTSMQLPTQAQSQQPPAVQVQIQNGGGLSGNLQIQGGIQNAQAIAQPSSATATAIAQGQFLLGSSAVLKLAGNIRLGEGLKLTQLRLPGATGAVATASSPLRLPQHRILLARGAIPGQSQGQGVLLGQTSTGQTVILSAASPTSSGLSSLQQALSSGNAAGVSVTTTQQQSSSITASLQQQSVPTTGVNQQNLTFTTQAAAAAAAAKFGIITSVPGNHNTSANSIIVSSGTSLSSISSHVQSNFSNGPRMLTAQTQQQQHSQTATSASISLPASMLTPVSSSASTPHPNVTVSSNHVVSQQSLSLASVMSSLSNCSPATVQLQGVAQAVQQQQHSLLAHLQQQASSSQGHNSAAQYGAPIIIRSAQGDFVSFGIPSHLSLGRGVQGIKVIPFPAGKQTVLAKIVTPGLPSGATVAAIPCSNASNVSLSSAALANVGVGSGLSVQNMNAMVPPASITPAAAPSVAITNSTVGIMNNQSSNSNASS